LLYHDYDLTNRVYVVIFKSDFEKNANFTFKTLDINELSMVGLSLKQYEIRGARQNIHE